MFTVNIYFLLVNINDTYFLRIEFRCLLEQRHSLQNTTLTSTLTSYFYKNI